MKDYKLIYFNGCPNHLPAVELLEKLGIDFEPVCQDELAKDDNLNGYSSPTLLKGEEILFGSKAHGGGCSIALPSFEALKEMINS